jgi:hypothetical protein
MTDSAWWPLDWKQEDSTREVAEVTLSGRKFLATRHESNPHGLPYGLVELSLGAALILFEDLMELRYHLSALEQGMLPL